MKQNANPMITKGFPEWRAITLEREKIDDVVDDLHHDYVDAEVEVAFNRRPYEGTRSQDTRRFRVVGIRNENTDDYHLYMTNLPREEFLPKDLAMVYRCRWEVALLFRELKTQYELDKFDTSNAVEAETLLYTALLSLLVSRDLLDIVTEQADDEFVFPPECWAATSGRTLSSSSTNSTTASATRYCRCWSG